MRFTKMHGLGNDYLYVFGTVPKNIAELTKKLSDRHFGVGGDGMIYIDHSKKADFRMRIFNADGSEAMMCGNGIRCVGKYLYDKGYTDKTRLKIETLSGIKMLDLQTVGGQVKTVSVQMGLAIPYEEKALSIDESVITCMPVSVGNPHAVIFVEDVNCVPLTILGPKLEHYPAFTSGANVEFVKVISANELRMRVWERGSGVTMACGTGACASVAAAVRKGLCPADETIAVRLDGGTLEIKVSSEGNVTMTGPAETVYEGEVQL